jgi:hypothetical protein
VTIDFACCVVDDRWMRASIPIAFLLACGTPATKLVPPAGPSAETQPTPATGPKP